MSCYFMPCVFMSCKFLSCNFMSCNFMPCYLVRHFHVLQFHALQLGPSISCPANSCPAILTVRHFYVRHFQSTRQTSGLIRKSGFESRISFWPWRSLRSLSAIVGTVVIFRVLSRRQKVSACDQCRQWAAVQRRRSDLYTRTVVAICRETTRRSYSFWRTTSDC